MTFHDVKGTIHYQRRILPNGNTEWFFTSFERQVIGQTYDSTRNADLFTPVASLQGSSKPAPCYRCSICFMSHRYQDLMSHLLDAHVYKEVDLDEPILIRFMMKNGASPGGKMRILLEVPMLVQEDLPDIANPTPIGTVKRNHFWLKKEIFFSKYFRLSSTAPSVDSVLSVHEYYTDYRAMLQEFLPNFQEEIQYYRNVDQRNLHVCEFYT